MSVLKTKNERDSVERRPVRPRRWSRPLWPSAAWVREAGIALTAAGISLAAAAGVLRLWRADLRVPLAYHGEGNYYLMLVKNIVERDGYFENPSLGAPYGQELYDLVIGTDGLNLLLIRVLGLVTSDPALVMNLFFLITFPLTGLTAVLVLRRLGVSAGPAVVCAVLFALLPYHFQRLGHLLLTAYYAVPIAVYLFLSVLSGKPLFARRERSGPRLLAWASRRTLLTVGLCVLVGLSGLYYSAFALLLLGVAAPLTLAVRSGRRTLATALAVLALVGVTVGVSLAPTLLYQAKHGANRAVLRTPQETEEFSLKVSELVLPTDGHRIGALAAWKDRYLESSLVRSERGQALGIVATAGFIWLWIIALLAILRRSAADSLTRYAAAAVVVSVLAATTGGLSTIFAYAVSPQLHAWNRLSVYIAFFSLLAVALLLERLRAVLRARRLPAAAFGAVLAVVFLAGALDQTSDRSIPPYADLSREYAGDESFVTAIEQHVPRGSSIFQLPYVPFPEAEPLVPMEDYDPVRGYLHSATLRWSYGAMKGRRDDWAGDLRAKPLRLVMPAVAAAGFDGVEVDGAGYPDGGRAARAELQRLVGSTPLAAADGRYAFFELGGYRQRLEKRLPAGMLDSLRRAALEPLHIEVGQGFFRQEHEADHSWHWAGPRAQLSFINPSRKRREAVLEARLERAPDAAEVLVELPDGSLQRHTAAPGGRVLRLAVTLEPGANVIRLSTRAPALLTPRDRRALYFRLVDTSLIERVLLQAASPA